MTELEEKALRYEEALKTILSCYNYEDTDKNAYLQWSKEKAQKKDFFRNSFPDFVLDTVRLALNQNR